MAVYDDDNLKRDFEYKQLDVFNAGLEAGMYTPKQLKKFADFCKAYKLQANATDAMALAMFYELGRLQQREADERAQQRKQATQTE